MPFQTFMTYFPLWNTKGDILANVQAAVFHKTMIYTGELHRNSPHDYSMI